MLSATAPGLLSATEAYRTTHEIFSEYGTVSAYLEVEKALARAEVRAGVITPEAGSAIVEACRIESLDLAALRRDAARVGYPIVPLVEQLATAAGDAGRWVHFGATTQDVMDTALVLQVRHAVPLVLSKLEQVCARLHDLADKHRHTVMAGRSKQQHALPVTFGYKVAVWLDQLDRQRRALQIASEQVNVVQFGGGVGTLAALGETGLAIRAHLANELRLTDPDITWHVSRDRFANLVHVLAMVNACLGKAALDVIHMMSTEIGELREPFAAGRGVSSTMPQKRNPVLSEAILEAARAAREGPSRMMEVMLQDHERAIGAAYIERCAVANGLMLAAGASELAHEIFTGIEVNSAKMNHNLDITNGLMMAESVMMLVARKFGRHSGHQKLHRACLRVDSSGQTLKEVLLQQEDIDGSDLDMALNPASYLGATDDMITCVLKRTTT